MDVYITCLAFSFCFLIMFYDTPLLHIRPNKIKSSI
jgi:hypothetical protein